MKIGTKITKIHRSMYGNYSVICFLEVVRFDNNKDNFQVAILSNGESEVVNKIYNQNSDYIITTERHTKIFEEQKQKELINNWFENRRFTDFQKEKIYYLFNPQ